MSESLQVFGYLNFLLQFCPTHPSEKELVARFAKLGIGPGKPFSDQELVPEIKKATRRQPVSGYYPKLLSIL